MIYTVGGIKGGSGKTTIATNMAVYLSSKNRDVLLIDADDQGSATDFTSWRSQYRDGITGYTSVQLFGINVRNEGLSLSKKFQDVVIDTGGRDTSSQRAALTISDIAIFPFLPRSLDVWTLSKLSNLIEEIKTVNESIKSYTFLNRADSTGSDNEEASKILMEEKEIQFVDAPIINRKAFPNASSKGLSVLEQIPSDQKAVAEIIRLFDNIIHV